MLNSLSFFNFLLVFANMVLENLSGTFSESCPFLLLVSLKTHAYLFNQLQNLFNSSVFVGLQWVGIEAQLMGHPFVNFAVLEKVPVVVVRPELVHKFPLFVVRGRFLLKLLCACCH